MKKVRLSNPIFLSLLLLLLIAIPVSWVAVSRLDGTGSSVSSGYDSPIKSLDSATEEERARLRAQGDGNGSEDLESGGMRSRRSARGPASETSLAQVAKDAPWWNQKWKKRRLIAWDPSRVGRDLLDFPVGLNVESKMLTNHLVVMDAEQTTPLPFEIEEAQTEGSMIWVKVPNLSEGMFWLYWNGPERESFSIGQNRDIWSPVFQSVFHLGESDDNFNASGTQRAVGMFASGREFRRQYKEFISLDGADGMLRSVSGATLSVWINARGIADTSNIVSIAIGRGGPTESSRATLILQGNGSIAVGGRASDEEPMQMASTAGGVIRPGQWHHVAGMINYEKSMISIMVDGVVSVGNSKVKFTQPESSGTSPISAVVGAEDNGEGSFFEGLMDEVRISGKALTPDWIRAEYEFRTKELIQFGEIQSFQ